MTEAELINRFNIDRPMYKAWGELVTSSITESLVEELGTAFKLFLRMPAIPRVKETSSLVNKSFYGKKKYADPYNEITDKVGVRFVVLLPKEIETISNIIIKSKLWTYSKDRDFEHERLENPMVFTYQSVHFVVTALNDCKHNGIEIAKGTQCEIQVRTILQHAYSELTHDTIYKPQVITSPSIHRTIAKSMALIETTDGFFHEVDKEIESLASIDKPLLLALSSLYLKNIGVLAALDKVNDLVIDAFRDYAVDIAEIQTFLKAKPFILNKIIEKRADKHLYRQAAIILVYFVAYKNSRKTMKQWPLTEEELRPIYIDMGLPISA